MPFINTLKKPLYVCIKEITERWYRMCDNRNIQGHLASTRFVTNDIYKWIHRRTAEYLNLVSVIYHAK